MIKILLTNEELSITDIGPAKENGTFLIYACAAWMNIWFVTLASFELKDRNGQSHCSQTLLEKVLTYFAEYPGTSKYFGRSVVYY